MPETRAGCVIVAGRPNVGKSTLFNRLLGERLSIATSKPHTTRYCIRGVIDGEDSQLVLIDTPGWGPRGRGRLSRHLSRVAAGGVPCADAGLLLVEAGGLRPADREVLGLLPPELPVVAGINKADLARSSDLLLPLAAELRQWRPLRAIVPLSARTGAGCDALAAELRALLPAREKLYPAGLRSDRKDAFFIADFIREQVLRRLDAEVPHAVGIEVRALERPAGKRLTRIMADILVDTPSRQAMVVGKGGRMLRGIGTGARRAIEGYLGGKVYLDLRVTLRRGWAEEPAQLARLGIEGGIV